MSERDRIEAAAEAMMQGMFAPHELPLTDWMRAKYRETARVALAAADRVAGIKSLNQEAAEGKHCDLDYRPDPVAGEDGLDTEKLWTLSETLRDREHRALVRAGADEIERLRAALALKGGS